MTNFKIGDIIQHTRLKEQHLILGKIKDYEEYKTFDLTNKRLDKIGIYSLYADKCSLVNNDQIKNKLLLVLYAQI